MAADLIEDIPCEAWLAERIEEAVTAGRNRWGVPAMQRITAYYREPVSLPIPMLVDLRGQRDEQGQRRDAKRIAELVASYRTHGVREDREDVPYIEVAYNGEAWVREGNHRIMAAHEAGMATLSVQIRYFDGGQRSPGPLAPERVEAHANAGDGTPMRPFDFSRDPMFHDWIYGGANHADRADRVKAFNQWLREHRDSFVRLYHGSSAHLTSVIREQGLRPTSTTRRNSLQSSNGYVSLSVYAGSAFEFGKQASLNKAAAADGAHVVVYPVVTTIRRLLSDRDQIGNKRLFGERPDIGDSLAESLMHGSGARVRGAIPPTALGWPTRYDRDHRVVGEGDSPLPIATADGPCAYLKEHIMSQDNAAEDRSHLLRSYRVSLREEPGDKFTIHFDCMAEDDDHAEEQALNAYPAGAVAHIALLDQDEEIAAKQRPSASQGFAP